MLWKRKVCQTWLGTGVASIAFFKSDQSVYQLTEPLLLCHQEPYFIPRRDGVSEDDGWIIAGIHNAETQHGEIAILDAQR